MYMQKGFNFILYHCFQHGNIVYRFGKFCENNSKNIFILCPCTNRAQTETGHPSFPTSVYLKRVGGRRTGEAASSRRCRRAPGRGWGGAARGRARRSARLGRTWWSAAPWPCSRGTPPSARRAGALLPSPPLCFGRNAVCK